jgi:uncharacterized protein (TIGR02099 family)
MLEKITPPRLKGMIAKRPSLLGKAWRKRALILLGLITAVFVIGHLAVRFVLWPQIEKSKFSIEKLISTRVGADVSIDKLEVHWTGIRPSFEIEGFRFNGPDQSKPLLFIQEINGELSWNSFYHLAPYFHELNFKSTQIYVRRDTKGQITIAGLPLHTKPDDYSAENWLFAQNDIQVHDLKLIWDDQKSQKQLSNIDIHSLTLSNGIRRHRGSLVASSPWTSGPLEIKVDFAHRLTGQAGNWKNWIGAIEWNVNNLNLTQIAKEFKLRPNTLEGLVTSKGKLNIDNGKPDGADINLAADNLVVQLFKDEDAIALGRLETNLIQENIDGMISVTTKTFAWRDTESKKSAPLENLSPMTFRWRPPGPDGEIKEFGFSSPKILVEDVALFALNLPLSKKVHRWIKDSHADGELQNLDITWSESKSSLAGLNVPGNWFKSNRLDFTVSTKLINLSFASVNKSIPSVNNLSGFITSNQNQGTFTVNSNDLELEVNNLLVDPKMKLDQAKGQISWAKTKGNWVVNVKDLALSNPEITTNLDLSYVLGAPGQPDLMSLDMDFPTAKLATAYRYLPVDMDKDTHHYLSKAFSAGTIQKGKLHIKGDPQKIPFPKGLDGEFSLKLPVTGVTYSPVPTLPSNQGVWSAFTNVNGVIAMQNSAFNVDISQGNYKQVALSQFHAEIPNVSAKQLGLSVSGKAQGEITQMLEYVFISPVGKNQTGLEKNLRATGNTALDVGLKIPLSGNEDTKVDLRLDLSGNRVQWADIPPLENLIGKIRITETNPEFENVSADFLGGKLKIATAPSTAGSQNYTVSGDISASFIKNYFVNTLKRDSLPSLEALSGTAKYEGLMSFSKVGSETNLKFDLRDLASTAPAPAQKSKGAPLMGLISIKTQAKPKPGNTSLSWSGKFGDLFSTQGELNNEGEMRYGLGVGAVANLPQQGFSLNLVSNELNVDSWIDFLMRPNSKNISNKEDDSSASQIQMTVQAKKFILMDRSWQDMNIAINQKGGVLQARISSPQANGQIQYSVANQTNPNGSLTGSFSHLRVPDMPAETTQANTSSSSNKKMSNLDAIPSLDLSIDDFSWYKAQLGQFKIKTTSSNNTIQIDSIKMNNPQGVSIITGLWLGANTNQPEQTQLKIDLDVKNAGQLISHWSAQKSVEGGQGKINASVQWSGPPYDPQYDTLKGNADLYLSKGRLLEVDTSGAQILDVLSMQSLFKFATFDLQGSLGNIVTKGTAFNSIRGGFDIQNGVAKTNQFAMNLDQARVVMNGQINIAQQTQDLRITIFPTINATGGSLAAFAINPIVGLGALVGQYLITSQINRNLQSDYLVQGTWKDPHVVPLDQQGQPIDSKAMETIRSKDLLKEQSRPGPNNPPTIPVTPS